MFTDLEIILGSIIILLFFIIIILLFKNYGKLYFNILKVKLNIQNKDNWSNDTIEITDKTKTIEIDFTMQLYNHKKTNNCLYNISLVNKKNKPIRNAHLNMTDTVKSITGSNTYEKLKYINLMPYEIKEIPVKLILTKDEFTNIDKDPLYITYKVMKKKKKINLKKILRKK